MIMNIPGSFNELVRSVIDSEDESAPARRGMPRLRRTAVLDICGECIMCFVLSVYLLTRVRGG